MLPKWAWSGSREQFLHRGLRKFRHSKSSVYRWYTQLDRRRFVYDTWEWDNGSRLGRVMVECTLSMTHCLRLNLQLHTIDLVRTCRISSFCTVVWQLARFQLIRRIARSLGDSWASCHEGTATPPCPSGVFAAERCAGRRAWSTLMDTWCLAAVMLQHGAQQQVQAMLPADVGSWTQNCWDVNM